MTGDRIRRRSAAHAVLDAQGRFILYCPLCTSLLKNGLVQDRKQRNTCGRPLHCPSGRQTNHSQDRQPMDDATRVLIVDLPEDAERIRSELVATLPQARFLQVATRDRYQTALASFSPDLILAELQLPGFPGMAALHLAQEQCHATPFLLVAGTLDLETAVAAMKSGAWDCLRKKDLARLAARVREALADKESRGANRDLPSRHEHLQTLFQLVELAKREWEVTMDCVDDVVILLDAGNRIRRCNKALATLAAGREYRDILGRNWPELREQLKFAETGAASEGPELFHSPSGRFFRTRSYPLEMAERMTAGSVITLHDISQRKLMSDRLEKQNSELTRAYEELKASQAKLLQQEKMASIGLLAAGVAHEINNPIGFVSSNLDTLDKYLERLTEFLRLQDETLRAQGGPAGETALAEARRRLRIEYLLDDIPALLGESRDGVDRVRTIVQNLKGFARIDRNEQDEADINQCLEETLNIIWNELKYKATVHREYGELPRIRCHPRQLNQVFMNLLLNAAQAIESRGEITVRTWADDADIFVTVEDTGCGILPEHLPRLFEPFFTTKEVGQGTGLGLSIVYDIVRKQHGGDIAVTSEVGRGTVFRVRLPLGERQECGAEETTEGKNAPRHEPKQKPGTAG